MLHSLAIATNTDTPTLLKKAISIEADQAWKTSLEAKERAMAKARGVRMPTKEVMFSNVPDPASRRLHNPTSSSLTGALAEKEIQKAHGVVAKSPMKQLRHNTVGKAKRAWGGKGLLGGKWRNRAAIVGGLGALGLGIKSYLSANKTPQPQAPVQVPREYMQQQEHPQFSSGYKAAALYSPDAAGIAPPAAPAKLTMPGPAVKSIPSITPGLPSGRSKSMFSGAPGKSTGTGSSTGSSVGSTGSKTASRGLLKSSDDMLFPLAAGAAGGLGGYALGTKVIAPILEDKASALALKIQRGQKILNSLQKAQKAAPLGAAAAGAILLAALAAIKARKSERQRMAPQGSPNPHINEYDPTGSGYTPEDQVPFGNMNFY